MVTVTSVSALQNAVVRAERQVQSGESRVNQDTARLDQSQNQLSRDRETLAQSQRDSANAARPATQAAPPINLSRAIERPGSNLSASQVLTSDLAASRPQVNSLGQTIGKFINVVA